MMIQKFHLQGFIILTCILDFTNVNFWLTGYVFIFFQYTDFFVYGLAVCQIQNVSC